MNLEQKNEFDKMFVEIRKEFEKKVL